MMAAMDKDSLFSLEVVVDKLQLSKVTCRFPAIAFRLLDFPTLIIYHVEPDLAEAIKRSMKRDPLYKMPAQLSELQDREGSFLVKKGKSCLLKVSPSMLLSHLQNTPLYVMVLDSFPEVPKLVGNCAVLLDTTMGAVFQDIETMGISVPSSHGEKGTFKISNLMGDEIGQITLAFRILSLGVGLIPHIPEKSIAKMGQGNISQPRIEKKVATQVAAMPKPMEQEATDIILEDLEAVDKNIQVVLSSPAPVQQREMISTQTQAESGQVAATQTDYIKKKKKTKVKMKQDHPMTHFDKELDDLFVMNVNTPPPLFYNSEMEPCKLSNGLTFTDYIAHKQRVENENSEESSDSDSTIRHEDVFSESELDSLTKPLVSQQQKRVETLKKPKSKQPPAKDKKADNPLGGLSQFPLLSAIMSEIVALQGAAPSNAVNTNHTHINITQPSRGFSPRRGATPRGTSVKIMSPRQEIIKQPHVSSPGRKPPQSAKQVKGKSWLKKETKAPNTPLPMAVAKTKIKPGMTNTQRLRLAKTNPQLLEKLEREEKERVEKFKARRRELGEGFSLAQLDVSTEIRHHPIGETYTPHQHEFDHDHPHKRPVPTPRLSLTAEQLDHITVSELPHAVPRPLRKDIGTRSEVGPSADQPSRPSTADTHSHRSASHLDVHMPVVSLHNDDDGDTSHDDASDVYHDEQDIVPEMTQTRSLPNPGFRKHNLGFAKPNPTFPKRTRVDSTQSNTSVQSAQYSDDFEDSQSHFNNGDNYEQDKGSDEESSPQHNISEGLDPSELLGLKKMIDTFSDKSSEDSGGELQGIGITGLRQIVDKYSDDDDPSKASTNSYFSAQSNGSDHKTNEKLRLNTSTVRTIAPSTSDMSPVIAVKQSTSLLRSGMNATSSSIEEHQPQVEESLDSTAYIHRSEMASQYSSIESTGNNGFGLNKGRPLPSPRKSLDHVAGGRLSPQEEDYSENFESADSISEIENVKQMRDADLAPEARFGYTWGGYT